MGSTLMTEKRLAWREALAPCYTVVAALAIVLALLRVNSGAAFWQLMYFSVLCSFLGMSITSSIFQYLCAEAQKLVRASNSGWKQANDLLKQQEALIAAMRARIEELEDDRTGT